MTAIAPPTYYFNGITFNPAYYPATAKTASSSGGGLTEAQANLLYLRKTTTDTATALETFSGGISTTTLNATGNATLTTLAVSGNETVGGTLGVSGITTATGGLYVQNIDSISTGGVINIGTLKNESAITIGRSGIKTNIIGITSTNTIETINSGGTYYDTLNIGTTNVPNVSIGNGSGSITLNGYVTNGSIDLLADVSGNPTIDSAFSPATLLIGPTSATAITMGKAGVTTTNLGDQSISGNLSVLGNTSLTSAAVSGNLSVTGNTIMTTMTASGLTVASGGVATFSMDTAAAGTLNIGGNIATLINIGKAGAKVELLGNQAIAGNIIMGGVASTNFIQFPDGTKQYTAGGGGGGGTYVNYPTAQGALTIPSATITTTLGVTGLTTATGGVNAPTFDCIAAGNGVLNIGMSNATVNQTYGEALSSGVLNIATNQTTGIINIGTNTSRSGAINIGTGFGASGGINLGSSANGVSIKGASGCSANFQIIGSTIATGGVATSTVDPYSLGTLAIGGTNASLINIGKSGVNTALLGDQSVAGNIVMGGVASTNYIQFPDGTKQYTAGGGGGGTYVNYPTAQGALTIPSATITTTLGVTGLTTATGGVATSSIDTAALAGALTVGGTNATASQSYAGALTTGTLNLGANITAGQINVGSSATTTPVNVGGVLIGGTNNSIQGGTTSTNFQIDHNDLTGSISLGDAQTSGVMNIATAAGRTAAGAVHIADGSTAAFPITIGGSGSTTTIGGTLTSSGLITASGGLTIKGNNNITLGNGSVAPTSGQIGYSYNVTPLTGATGTSTTATKNMFTYTLPSAGVWSILASFEWNAGAPNLNMSISTTSLSYDFFSIGTLLPGYYLQLQQTIAATAAINFYIVVNNAGATVTVKAYIKATRIA